MRSVNQRVSNTRSRLTLCCVVMAIALMTGCATGFFYNRLDTLASWYFEDLVSLNDDQRIELREWLARTLAWHRRSEMRRYAAFVDELATQTATPGDKARYDALRGRFESYVDDLVGKTVPEASELLLSLSTLQTKEMLDSLAAKAKTRSEKNARTVASGKWQRQQRDDIEKQLKRWTGSVSSQQSNLIESGVAQLEPTYIDWAASQQSWRSELQKALQTDRSDTAMQQHVAALMRTPQQHWIPLYAQKVARNRERYLTLLVDIDATLSPAQRQRLRAELRKLSGQLAKLAEDNQGA